MGGWVECGGWVGGSWVYWGLGEVRWVKWGGW